MNEDSVQKKAKYLNMGKCIKKTFIIFLVVLLVLIMLPIGVFVSYVAFIRCGNTVLFTYETEKGHTVTVTQSGRHEQLTNTYLILITVDDEKYIKFHFTDSTEGSIFPSEGISCVETYDEISLKIGNGTLPPEVRFSSDFSMINFIRSEGYTLLKENIEVITFELVDPF